MSNPFRKRIPAQRGADHQHGENADLNFSSHIPVFSFYLLYDPVAPTTHHERIAELPAHLGQLGFGLLAGIETPHTILIPEPAAGNELRDFSPVTFELPVLGRHALGAGDQLHGIKRLLLFGFPVLTLPLSALSEAAAEAGSATSASACS